jgi:hypothetical protein
VKLEVSETSVGPVLVSVKWLAGLPAIYFLYIFLLNKSSRWFAASAIVSCILLFRHYASAAGALVGRMIL